MVDNAYDVHVFNGTATDVILQSITIHLFNTVDRI